ncbi:MAG: alpha/beta hydrolase [Acidimicrobiia bacterium]
MSSPTRLAARVGAFALLAVACSQAADSPPTTAATTSTTSSTTSTSTSTSTSIATAPSTTSVETTADETGPGPHGVEIYLPALTEGAPVAVLVHGGGWVGGLPASIAPLGRALSDRGMVVFNASYRTLSAGGGYPDTFDDVACAVRYARSRGAELEASDQIMLIGHSAGAHLAATVALSDDAFGGDCPWGGSSTPQIFVGLAGIYQIEAVEPVMELLLGGSRETAPEAWAGADPFEHLGSAAGMTVTLIHGTDDGIVPSGASKGFQAALEALDVDAVLELVPGATHMDMLDPDVTADLIPGG